MKKINAVAMTAVLCTGGFVVGRMTTTKERKNPVVYEAEKPLQDDSVRTTVESVNDEDGTVIVRLGSTLYQFYGNGFVAGDTVECTVLNDNGVYYIMNAVKE